MAPHGTIDSPTPTTAFSDNVSKLVGARLVLSTAEVVRGRLDGGWWPRSRDAEEQLPELVTELNAPLGVVLRLAVDVLAWDRIPHRIEVAGRVVRVGWYAEMNHMLIVTLGRHVHLRLLVVPPEADPVAARSALARVMQPDGTGAQEILESCGIETEPITRLSARPILT